MENTIGAYGRIFRIGGDEFVVFAQMDRAQAASAIDALTRATSAWSGQKVDTLSVSVGCVFAEDLPGASIEGLVREADMEMYDQKKEYYLLTGRDRRR